MIKTHHFIIADFNSNRKIQKYEKTALLQSRFGGSGFLPDSSGPIHSFLFYPGKENSLGGVVYLAEYVSGEVLLDNKEHGLYKWATLSEIEQLEGTKGLLQEFVAYKKFLENIKTLCLTE